MTLEEAIRIKERTLGTSFPVSPEDIYKADQLSIEALKRVYLLREHPKRTLNILLSGETID